MTPQTAPKPMQWAASHQAHEAYAARLQAATTAFNAHDSDTRTRMRWMLERMGTSAAPVGTTTFADIVEVLAGYGLREADQLFAADLRAIGRLG